MMRHVIAHRERHMVGLDADSSSGSHLVANCAPVIVTPPVGIDDVFRKRPAPRLAAVNVGGDRDAARASDDATVGPAEAAVEKAGVVSDAVHRRE
jgi:hypothetical protein